MSKKAKKPSKVRAVDLYSSAKQRGLTGDKLAGFKEGLDLAAYLVRIEGMVDCGDVECGYRRPHDPRCKECPQHLADRIVKGLRRFKK